jgi:hypothetical protein
MASRFVYDPSTCTFSVELDRDSLREVEDLFDIDRLTRYGCRVKKHPDCCVLCAANNDCRRVPLHFNCRCEPEPFLASFEE